MDQKHEVSVSKIGKDPAYQAEFAQAFGPGTVTLKKIQKSLASFERTLLSGNSPFDQYQYGGKKQALSPARSTVSPSFKTRREAIALSAIPSIRITHSSPMANSITPGRGEWSGDFTDLGRFNSTKIGIAKGEFKTPTLRDVALSAPYMHDGSLKTLKDVVDFYAGGGNSNPYLDKEMKPLHLSAQDREDLVAFLKALTGEMPANDGPPGERLAKNETFTFSISSARPRCLPVAPEKSIPNSRAPRRASRRQCTLKWIPLPPDL